MQEGLNAFHRGHFAEAVSKWQEAAQIYKSTHQSAAYIKALIHLAQAFEALGRYDQAIHSLHTARPLAQRLDNRQQLAMILASLGQQYVVMGRWEQAEKALQDARSMAKHLDDAYLTAVILNNLGNLFISQQPPRQPDFLQARTFYQQSAQTALQANHQAMAGRAFTHAAMAAIQAYGKDHTQLSEPPETVRTLLDDALTHLQASPMSHATVVDVINVGLAYHHLSLYLPEAQHDLRRRAAEVLLDATDMAQRLQNQRTTSYALGHLGHIYEAAHRYPEAISLTQRALLKAQQAAFPDALYQWQWQMGRLFKALDEGDKAITFYQRAVETVQTLRDALPCASGRSQSDVRSTIGPLFFELADLLIQRGTTAVEPDRSREDLKQARRVIEQFKQAELQDYFGDACVGTEPANARVIDNLSTTALVIYPIVLPERLELLVSGAGELWRFRVPVRADKLEAVAQGFRQALQNDWLSYKRLAQMLYNWLIRPVESRLANFSIQTLVFVPDGILRTIPFAALHDGQRFLIETYAVAMTTGLHLTAPEPIRPAQLRILAAGVSAFPEPDFSALPYVGPELQAMTVSALPHVEQELQAVEKLFPDRVKRLSEFRLADLEEALQREPFDVVHLASHGIFSSDVAQSLILDADGKPLTMPHLEQIVGRLRFRTKPLELLSLSACETALGDTRATDVRAALGLAGIAVQSGARSALATLWRVNDQASAELIETFYRHLRTPGISRALALQKAQVALLRHATTAYHHPYYWAPFMLINNWL